jgi:6-phosphogluconolactonase
MKIFVHETPEAIAEAASTRIATLISVETDRFSLGLAGGSTPAATYRHLRGRVSRWDKVDAWLSDERWVPHDHERCNGLMAQEALLNHVDAQFHRPQWSESMDAADAAAYYEADMRSLHRDRRPDLVMLGLGSDGHTASLFPGNQALEELERWYIATWVPQWQEHRLTATYPLLWRAKLIVIAAFGENKAPAVRDSFEGTTPAGRLGDGDAEVEWHLDEEAASLLD